MWIWEAKMFKIFKFKKTRIFAISDLHFSTCVDKPMDVFGGHWQGYEKKIELAWKKQIKKNDIVIVAGDLSWGMTIEQAIPDLNKISSFGGRIVICRGNHDYWWKSISAVRDALKSNMFALQNDAIVLDDFVFCGTRGWIVSERNKTLSLEDQKILNREVQRMKLALDAASKLMDNKKKLIVVMHYPPLNFKLDDSPFTELFDRFGVNYVVFGHVHGKSKRPISFIKNNTKYFLTSCDQLENKLIRIC